MENWCKRDVFIAQTMINFLKSQTMPQITTNKKKILFNVKEPFNQSTKYVHIGRSVEKSHQFPVTFSRHMGILLRHQLVVFSFYWGINSAHRRFKK